MDKLDKFYITTPIYYVNDKPHIGHAYTTILADVLARFYRSQIGDENVYFLTGTDEHGAKVAESAEKQGISPQEFTDQVSKEFSDAWKNLDISNDHFIRTTDKKHQQAVVKILEKLKSIINKVDLIVFSDFNYGCLPQNLVDEISTLAKDNNVIMAADSQSSSQIGDISRFKNMNLITPTEREARISLRNSQDGLVVLAETLQKKALADNVILKIGEEGILIHTNNDNKKSEWLTDRIGALNPTPKDVAGAGDSLLISSALTMAIGGSIWDASLIGSLSAAIQVSRMGNIPLKVEELISGLG